MNVNKETINKKVTTAFISEEEIKELISSHVMKSQSIEKDSVKVRSTVTILNEDSSTGFHPKAKVVIEEYE